MGAVPFRKAMGDGQGGLQRGRGRLEFLHPRPRPLPRLPLGRGRHRRDLRRQAAALLRTGPVERQGPDPQGAPLRADQQRGEPRRGRQGVLLLPRLDADPLLHEVPLQVPPGRLPLRRSRAHQRAAVEKGDGVRTDRHGRLRRRPLFRRLRGVRQGRTGRHPGAHHGPQPRARSCGTAPAADPVVPQRLGFMDIRGQPGPRKAPPLAVRGAGRGERPGGGAPAAG